MPRTTIATLALLTALAGPAAAQDWPTRPITLVVPFTPGGGIDVSARIQALQMGELLGQPIVVDTWAPPPAPAASASPRPRPTATR